MTLSSQSTTATAFLSTQQSLHIKENQQKKLGKISFYKRGKELKLLVLLAGGFWLLVLFFFYMCSKIIALSNETLP